MAIEGLTIIGESINDSVPTTAQLYDAEDFEGIKRLAMNKTTCKGIKRLAKVLNDLQR